MDCLTVTVTSLDWWSRHTLGVIYSVTSVTVSSHHYVGNGVITLSQIFADCIYKSYWKMSMELWVKHVIYTLLIYYFQYISIGGLIMYTVRLHNIWSFIYTNFKRIGFWSSLRINNSLNVGLNNKFYVWSCLSTHSKSCKLLKRLLVKYDMLYYVYNKY